MLIPNDSDSVTCRTFNCRSFFFFFQFPPVRFLHYFCISFELFDNFFYVLLCKRTEYKTYMFIYMCVLVRLVPSSFSLWISISFTIFPNCCKLNRNGKIKRRISVFWQRKLFLWKRKLTFSWDRWRNRIKFFSRPLRGPHARISTNQSAFSVLAGMPTRQIISLSSFTHFIFITAVVCTSRVGVVFGIVLVGEVENFESIHVAENCESFTAEKYATQNGLRCQTNSLYILSGILVHTLSTGARFDSNRLVLRNQTLVYWSRFTKTTATTKKDMNMKTPRCLAIKFVSFKKKGRDRESDSMICTNLTYRSRIWKNYGCEDRQMNQTCPICRTHTHGSRV